MPTILSESDAFPTTLQVPAAGEGASAPTLTSQFFQGAANQLRWLFNRVTVFVTGGTLTSSASVALVTTNGSGGGYTVNNTYMGTDGTFVAGNGGASTVSFNCSGLSSNKPLNAPRAIIQGDGTAGTHFYGSNNEIVYAPASIAGGCIWQLASTPAGYYIRVLNHASTSSIVIKNSDGTTINSINGTPGSLCDIELVSNGTLWSIFMARVA